MACPFNEEALTKLKTFINICKENPELLHNPALVFFKNYIESLGGKIPEKASKLSDDQDQKPEEMKVEEVEEEEDVESELELDMTGCLEPDEPDPSQRMGTEDKEITENDVDQASSKRIEAMCEFGSGSYDKAIHLLTEAIEMNPQAALLFAKRGQVYLKIDKPNACIKDCSKALELNPDSAIAYKYRGRAYRLIGKFEEAAQDLRQACKIDFDEETDQWLKEVTPNAKRIEEHTLKMERKKIEKERKEKLKKAQKAKEAHAKASSENQKQQQQQQFPHSPFEGQMPSGDFANLFKDPDLLEALKDPEVAEAFKDISSNPMNFLKYQGNPKIMALLSKLMVKTGMGAPGTGGFPGTGPMGGGATQFTPTPNDDNLD